MARKKKKKKKKPVGAEALAAIKKYKITALQYAWAVYYLQTKNATAAAKLAGYKGGSESAFGVVGWQNKNKPNIKKFLSEQMGSLVLTKNETLYNLSLLATIVNVADYLKHETVTTTHRNGDYEREEEKIVVVFDVDKFNDDGYGYLIESVRNTAHGPNYYFRSPESANVWVAKHHAAFTDSRDPIDLQIRVSIKKPTK